MHPPLRRFLGSRSRPHARRRSTRRPLAVTLLCAAALVLPAATASAHVTVHPDSTTSGSYAQLTFRVPNESASAGTVHLQVTLPQDHPLTFVSTKPVPGWSVAVRKAPLPAPVEVHGATITEAPRTVTWTADDGTQVRPGEYQDFPISVGPLPSPGTLVLPAVQTYSDGTVVRWAEEPAQGEAEPEHPAPSFVITSAATEANGSRSGGEDPAAPSAVAGDGDALARWLAAAALAVGVLAGAGVLLSRRRDTGVPAGRTTAGTP